MLKTFVWTDILWLSIAGSSDVYLFKYAVSFFASNIVNTISALCSAIVDAIAIDAISHSLFTYRGIQLHEAGAVMTRLQVNIVVNSYTVA